MGGSRTIVLLPGTFIPFIYKLVSVSFWLRFSPNIATSCADWREPEDPKDLRLLSSTEEWKDNTGMRGKSEFPPKKPSCHKRQRRDSALKTLVDPLTATTPKIGQGSRPSLPSWIEATPRAHSTSLPTHRRLFLLNVIFSSDATRNQSTHCHGDPYNPPPPPYRVGATGQGFEATICTSIY